MEKAENGIFVSVDYKGTLQNGEVFDTSSGRQPLEVQIGAGKARKGGIVAVSCTRARYVKKPRGARPGTVRIRKETVFKVRPGMQYFTDISGFKEDLGHPFS